MVNTNHVSPIADFRAIIPAGGAGTRLWPLSRAAHPKFLLDLTGTGSSLLQATVQRLRPLAGPDGIAIVTGVLHEEAVRSQVDGAQVFVEPSPRNSMAAIGLAAAVLAVQDGDVVIGSFAADHVIRDAEKFESAVHEAVVAARAGYLVTIGIEATSPATGFGYIECGEELGLEAAPSARKVVAFTEKPDADTAADYLATGHYRWNAGMFVVRAQVLLGHLQQQKPQLCAGLIEIAQAWDTPERDEVLARVWPNLERISIDHALAEPVSRQGMVATVPGSFAWSDVGDYESVAQVFGGEVRLGDEEMMTILQSPGAVVVADGQRQITAIGVPEIVIVDTPDALLVTTREHAQQVKDVVDHLRGSWRKKVL